MKLVDKCSLRGPRREHRSAALLVALLTTAMILAALTAAGMRMEAPRVVAHSGDVFGPSCGVATIDGVIDQVEWSATTVQTITIANPGTTTTPLTATLRVMNSANSLYLGFTVADDEFTTVGQYLPAGDSVLVVFDNDHSGDLFATDDDVLLVSAGSPPFSDNHIVGTPVPTTNHEDTIDGGSTDGAGAASRISNWNHFEVQHPLCSGDALDFCLQPGATVGFRLEYNDAEGNGSFGGSRFFPGASGTSVADIVIGPCSIPDLFNYLPLTRR